MSLLSLPATGFAEPDPLEELGDESEEKSEERGDASEAPPQSTIDTGKPASLELGSVKLEAGAPRPGAQTPGVAPTPPPAPGAPPPPPTVKVGGGFILAYFHSFGLEDSARRLGIPVRKPYMEAFRAAIFLDSKVDRWGVHIEFRARDKKVRNFFEGTSWLEEVYGSVDIIKPDNINFGPMTLKVGKSYTQFAKFWDDQFYGNPQLRDGLKLDANYGVSLEGTLGAKKLFGAKYWGQYYIIDGGTNTSSDGRDTISVAAPNSGYPSGFGRRRNIINGRIEPFLQFNETMSIKLGASLQNFTADFGPTMKQENVIRYAGDLTVNLNWVSFWGEYSQQMGHHVLNHPFGPGAAITAADPYGRPLRGTTPARSSDSVRYALAGAKVSWKGVTLRYHFSMADYQNVLYPAASNLMLPDSALPKITVRETAHTPGITIAVVPQMVLMIELPIHKRFIPAARSVPGAVATEYILDKSVVVTLHGRM